MAKAPVPWKQVDWQPKDTGPGAVQRVGSTLAAGGKGALRYGLTGLGYAAHGLDFLRRSRDVLGHQIGDSLYSLVEGTREAEINARSTGTY